VKHRLAAGDETEKNYLWLSTHDMAGKGAKAPGDWVCLLSVGWKPTATKGD
jgi:hypothetical protein